MPPRGAGSTSSALTIRSAWGPPTASTTGIASAFLRTSLLAFFAALARSSTSRSSLSSVRLFAARIRFAPASLRPSELRRQGPRTQVVVEPLEGLLPGLRRRQVRHRLAVPLGQRGPLAVELGVQRRRAPHQLQELGAITLVPGSRGPVGGGDDRGVHLGQ